MSPCPRNGNGSFEAGTQLQKDELELEVPALEVDLEAISRQSMTIPTVATPP